jgi:NAD(P)-dependent dehydrogenase (short-subunit alcohol dehydrogenase family)
MDLGLAGKVAVVTGASKGIGLAITRALVDVVLLLASDRAGNVTGSDFVIDGGLITTL